MERERKRSDLVIMVVKRGEKREREREGTTKINSGNGTIGRGRKRRGLSRG